MTVVPRTLSALTRVTDTRSDGNSVQGRVSCVALDRGQ